MTRISEVINIKGFKNIKKDEFPIGYPVGECVLTDEQREAFTKLMKMDEAESKEIFDRIIKHPIDLKTLSVINKIE